MSFQKNIHVVQLFPEDKIYISQKASFTRSCSHISFFTRAIFLQECLLYKIPGSRVYSLFNNCKEVRIFLYHGIPLAFFNRESHLGISLLAQHRAATSSSDQYQSVRQPKWGKHCVGIEQVLPVKSNKRHFQDIQIQVFNPSGNYKVC